MARILVAQAMVEGLILVRVAPDGAWITLIARNHAERFVRSVRSECLEHFVIFGEQHLRYLLREFVEHYHTERYIKGSLED